MNAYDKLRHAIDGGEFLKTECINCHREIDIRDTFFLMDVPYCGKCTLIVAEHRAKELE